MSDIDTISPTQPKIDPELTAIAREIVPHSSVVWVTDPAELELHGPVFGFRFNVATFPPRDADAEREVARMTVEQAANRMLELIAQDLNLVSRAEHDKALSRLEEVEALWQAAEGRIRSLRGW